MKQTTTELEKQIMEKTKECESGESELAEAREEIAHYQRVVGKYKEIARTAEVSKERIESLEEELREKIRENHHLQIKVRSMNNSMERMTEKTEKQNDKITQLQAAQITLTEENAQMKRDNAEYKESNGMLTEKLNILLKENADNTLKTEKQIESIENYHLSKYKALLSSYQTVKRRIAANQTMSRRDGGGGVMNGQNAGYSNRGWKKGHEDHNAHYSFDSNGKSVHTPTSDKVKGITYAIDLDVDEEELMENINDLNDNIKDLSTPTSSFNVRKYQHRVLEYKQTVHSLQKQLKEYQQALEQQRRMNKKLQDRSKRSHKPKNVNYDYLRNVLVKFLILSEYLTDDQIVLVPVLSSILRLSAKEKQMIDEAYNSNSYFMGAVELDYMCSLNSVVRSFIFVLVDDECCAEHIVPGECKCSSCIAEKKETKKEA